MPRPLVVAVGAALALAAAPALLAAEYYKWIDENGVTHYTQQPPPEDAKVKLDAATLPASTPEAPPDAAETKAGDNDAANAEDSDDKGPNTVAEFCKRLRQQEQKLASDRPVRTRKADGTLEPLEGKARRQRLERVRGQLQQHCRGESADAG